MSSQKTEETSGVKEAMEAALAGTESEKTKGGKKRKGKFADAARSAKLADVAQTPAAPGGKKETRAITVDIREAGAAINAAKNKEKAEKRTGNPQAQEMRRRLTNILTGAAEWVENPYAEGDKKFCSSGMQVPVSNCYIVLVRDGAVVTLPTSNLAMEVSQDMLTEERSKRKMEYHELLRKDNKWNRLKIVRGKPKAQMEAESLSGKISASQSVVSTLEGIRDSLDEPEGALFVRALVDEDDLVSLAKRRWSDLEALKLSLGDSRLEDPLDGEGSHEHFVILKIGEGERDGENVAAAFIIPISRGSVTKIRNARKDEASKPSPDAEKLRLLELHEIPHRYDDTRRRPFQSFIAAVRAAKKQS